MTQQQDAALTIDAYIAQQDEKIQPLLHKMRETIRLAAPEAKEKISWAMPTFYLVGNLCHFAANKHFIGFYPGSEGVSHFASRLTAYKTSKGAVQFPYKEELPCALITEIVVYLVKEAQA